MRSLSKGTTHRALIQVLKILAGVVLLQTITLIPAQAQVAGVLKSVKITIEKAVVAPLNSQVDQLESYDGVKAKPAKKTLLREVLVQDELKLKDGRRMPVRDIHFLYLKAPQTTNLNINVIRPPKDDD